MSVNSIIAILLFLIIFNTSCIGKSQYKNLTSIKRGDSSETIIDKWGEPDRKNTAHGPMGTSEVWVYECTQSGDNGPGCQFLVPCYYVYVLNGKLLSIYDNTDQF